MRTRERALDAGSGEICIVASGAEAPAAKAALRGARLAAPESPESLALLGTRVSGRRALLACGADARGLVYALLELADRVRPGRSPLASLVQRQPVVERPANAVRSVMRQFTSETLDKRWFYDREQWMGYLAMIATHRFNRLHLAFGFGYDSLQRVTDSYLLFAYPFLLPVPGYDVRATNLPEDEQRRNLETLRFVSEETVRRGLDFQVGVWMHGYQLTDSPSARYVIEGLTPETHAAYCRDALTTLLRACPAVTSIGLRIHGESGIAEGSYEFWQTVFEGVARCGRPVEIDLHAKGIDATMIERALATGMPVNVSPKFAAEHLGMPYHQAAIRELEMPVPGRTGQGLMALSEGARVFTRYGYADLLRDDRRYTVRPRVFSGTQRLLAWGDPLWAASYARTFQYCGMTGADLMEPLTCRGRRGTGAGRRDGYAVERLAPRWDWEKYASWYRCWGRTTYSPETGPEVFRRDFGEEPGALALASALAKASRILPIVTSACLPSAACDAYWPEICWNQPMTGEPPRDPYFDTPEPRTFQNASPLDPQLFSSASEFAEGLLRGARGAKCSPADVAQWLDDLSGGALDDLVRAGGPRSPDRERVAADVRMLAGLGRFFARKFRAAVLTALFERTDNPRALEAALRVYGEARREWATLADQGRGLYQADLSASDRPSERGQWIDRLRGIDEDIRRMAERQATAAGPANLRVSDIVALVSSGQLPPFGRPSLTHRASAGFHPGEPLILDLAAAPRRGWASAVLRYRHVNQAERWQAAEMNGAGGAWRASIPGDYTESPFPLQYYFEVRSASGSAWLHPGFGPDLANQPYFVVRRI